MHWRLAIERCSEQVSRLMIGPAATSETVADAVYELMITDLRP